MYISFALFPKSVCSFELKQSEISGLKIWVEYTDGRCVGMSKFALFEKGVCCFKIALEMLV
jgi:hypothetical protein